MRNLTKTLLCGVAVSALAIAPAIAENTPASHFTMLNGGRVVNKTKLHNHGATHITYTFGFYDYLPASYPLHQKIFLQGAHACNVKKVTVAPKKTAYAKIGINIETYSNGCELVQPTYTLFKQPDPGATDQFVLSIADKFEQNGTKYKGTLNLDHYISFE